ncbi:MAG: hypothetical protein WAU61_07335 [Smithella sp.]
MSEELTSPVYDRIIKSIRGKLKGKIQILFLSQFGAQYTDFSHKALARIGWFLKNTAADSPCSSDR